MIIEWCDDFLIGMDELDSDHRDLIDGFNRIAVVIETRRDEALALFELWLATFLRHTVKEELLLNQLRYPDGRQHRDDHNAGHRQFLAKAREFQAQVTAGGPHAESIARLGLFLAVTELVRADYEMIGHLRREGVLRPDGSICAAQ